MRLWLDHLAVFADSVAAGVEHVRQALGVTMPAGGAHREMGTHNHLLRLGDDLFLEAIAIDPAASPPGRARWFDLDAQAREGRLVPPRLGSWVVRTDDLDAALASVPHAAGPAVRASRGTLSWRIGVPGDGAMAFGGAFPTIMQWPDGPHPAGRMPDLGCRLIELTIEHPEADLIAASLCLRDDRVSYRPAPAMRLSARIATSAGERLLA